MLLDTLVMPWHTMASAVTTKGHEMKTQVRQYQASELGEVISKSRELLVGGVLIRNATIKEVLPELFKLRESDVAGRAEVLTMTKTVKARFMLSGSGAELYVLKPVTRVVDGVKKSMLAIVSVVPLSGVLAFELRGDA